MATWMLGRKGQIRHLLDPAKSSLEPAKGFSPYYVSVCGVRLLKARTDFLVGMDMFPQLGFRKCKSCVKRGRAT